MKLGQAYVGPVGFFAPGYRSAAAWTAGERDPSAIEASAEVLSTRLRRGASPLTRMFVDVCAQVFAQSDVDPRSVRLVFGSAFGEVDTALRIIADQHPDRPAVSPARFKSSVSNTAAGLLSIETGNRLAATTVSAGHDTFAMTWIEALALLRVDETPVLFAVADEAVPPALYFGETYAPMALAFLLTRDAMPGSVARLERIVRETGAIAPPVPAEFAASPLAAALPFVRALASRERSSRLRISGPSSALSAELSYLEATR